MYFPFKNFIPPPGAVKQSVQGQDDAVQYIMPSGSVWEVNEKARQLGHMDSSGKNMDEFKVDLGIFQRHGEGNPPDIEIVSDSKPPGGSILANPSSKGTSASMFGPQKNKGKMPGASMFGSSPAAGGGASIFPKFVSLNSIK